MARPSRSSHVTAPATAFPSPDNSIGAYFDVAALFVPSGPSGSSVDALRRELAALDGEQAVLPTRVWLLYGVHASTRFAHSDLNEALVRTLQHDKDAYLLRAAPPARR